MSFLCLLFVACEKETHINDPSSTSQGIINRNSDHQFSYRKPYQKTDVNFANLTTVVNDLIQKNPAFRNLIKNQSLLQFDGDYNVLLETLSPLSFFDADVNGQTIQTVESLINDAYNQHNFVVNTDPSTFALYERLST